MTALRAYGRNLPNWRPIKWLAAVLATVCLLVSPATALADRIPPNYIPILPIAFYERMGSCETGRGQRDAKGKYSQPANYAHETRSYTGPYGVYVGTARMFGYGRLGKYTPEQSRYIFDVLAFRGNKHHKPIGLMGWGCFKAHKYLRDYVAASTNPLAKGWKYR